MSQHTNTVSTSKLKKDREYSIKVFKYQYVTLVDQYGERSDNIPAVE